MSTWKVQHLDKPLCTVSFIITKNETYNGCNNRMHQDIGTKWVTLTLENITVSDEGNYTCEVVNEGGTLTGTIILEVLAKPFALITLTGSRSAECRAVGGHPATTVWWNSALLNEVSDTTSIEKNKTSTVISTYTPVEDNETEATCTVHHPAFPSPLILTIKIPAAAGMKNMWWVLIPVVVIIVITVIILLLWQISGLRTFSANKRGNTSEPQENPTVIVEDVEPYASFTQKVNTIYNSTSELSEAKMKDLTTDYGIQKIRF
ncbi:PREDICTED: cell surface glycoprotein CD200 receptor 1 [Nanorana parkeri]|uniref:cell surface glycoprotein CD200 receptor 1 n=1 Tax=Nanorana parkeri TaxID=125878 RepID=UPI000854D39B|nr:PREDICTED: cell surface glycoprotein CD200 receptor 1 [Nanorana parkeri]